ncbi:hypothetical protein E3E36_11895, partial [Thermococcus sp. M36]|uniref:hypothetical protein n=1 Tax=Thermococcus sp. M36 TaxID=1638261 RepID=UPI0016A543CE
MVKDYYSNGKIYSKGYFKRIDNTSESVFGLWTYWYDNGQIKSQEYYYLNKKPVYYINFWQKSGIQILKNGNGYIYETMAFRTDDSTIFEIKDSLKNGNFKCYALEKNSFYLFSTGKYIGGVIHGKKIIYYP